MSTDTKTAHTPGPWEITGFSDCQLITKDVPPALGQPIGIGRTYGENQIANARLIAATPDMFAIHQDSIEILEIVLEEREAVNGEEDEVLRDLIARIKAAIAKAEGRAR